MGGLVVLKKGRKENIRPFYTLLILLSKLVHLGSLVIFLLYSYLTPWRNWVGLKQPTLARVFLWS